MGNFDGVHRGHQAIPLARLRERALELSAPSARGDFRAAAA
ncbi:MAG: hypothetical protein PW845_22705 [Pseudomonas sp.]|nr:hypothetical protein [Pseudomonas sp.]